MIESMTNAVRLRLGDRELWLVPAAAIEIWPRAHADLRLDDAMQSWPGALEVQRVCEVLFGPSDTPDRASAFVGDALDREHLVAVRLDAGFLGRPRVAADDLEAWDDLPLLSDLSPAALDARTRPDGGRGVVEPTRPGGPGTSGDDDGGARVPSTFVAFVVVDQHGTPLHGAWSCTPSGKPSRGVLDRKEVRVDALARDTSSVEVTLSELALPSSAP